MNIDPDKWQRTKLGFPVKYLRDVWEVVKGDAKVLRELLAIVPGLSKVVLIGGSPCQDLTFMSAHGGILGVTGPTSYHFHVFVAIVVALRAIEPNIDVFVVVENAGSMKEYHFQYMLDALGLPKACFKKIDYGKFVRRNRFFLSNTTRHVPPPEQISPWDVGWRSSPILHHRLMPWLRARGVTARGAVIRTAGAYHPHNLLYLTDAFGGKDAFESLWEEWRLAKHSVGKLYRRAISPSLEHLACLEC